VFDHAERWSRLSEPTKSLRRSITAILACRRPKRLAEVAELAGVAAQVGLSS
jgi:hypothetical protein